MTDEQSTSGNGTSGDDRKLASDLDDWIFAGRGIFRVVGRLGRSIPPFGEDSRSELAALIAATDAEFGGLVDAWQTEIRPSLDRHADHFAPEWVQQQLSDARYVPAVPPVLDAGQYSDGYWIDHWTAAATHLIGLAEGLRDCIPPGDEGVAWSITAHHLPRVDEQFGRVVDGWNTAVRPRLQKYERRPSRR